MSECDNQRKNVARGNLWKMRIKSACSVCTMTGLALFSEETNETENCSFPAEVCSKSSQQAALCPGHCTTGVCTPGDHRPQDRKASAYSCRERTRWPAVLARRGARNEIRLRSQY